MTTTTAAVSPDLVGGSPPRPDGMSKARGTFEFVSDLHAEGMLWAAILRSPVARAALGDVDTAAASRMQGVAVVISHKDTAQLPGFGLMEADQPVFANQEIRHWGEPIAAVAAEDAETARRAIAAMKVQLNELRPVTDPEEAERIDSVFHRVRVRRGDQTVRGEVVVEGYYEVGQQDQAPLGTEAGLAIPDGHGGVDLWATSQWIHSDHEQLCRTLGLAPHELRCHVPGMGGAFGAGEDITVHIHLCLLALRTGRPVKFVADRAESFASHVHRHPARMWYRHEATRDGELLRVTAKLLLDGGAYMSTTPQVVTNATLFAVGPYAVESVAIDGVGVRTNNPPAGAMRGFGNVQACFAHEMQMTRLAKALGLDQLELRRRNALGAGDRLSTTGQLIAGSLPVREVIDALEHMSLPAGLLNDRELPGGTGNATDRRHIQRGVGYGLSIKNLGFSNGFDDYADARVVLTDAGLEVHTAAVEVGQGLVTALQQLARTASGVGRVTVVFEDTSRIGSAGSTSASRQTQLTGGAVVRAAEQVRAEALVRWGGDDLDDAGVWRDGSLIATLGEITANGPIESSVRFRHPETTPIDEDGQGNPHADFAVAGHRAVVDVDPRLGLVRVVRVDTAQDVGRALHPEAVRGQIEGGTLQGVGLALTEELVVSDGCVANGSFTDYLLPTFPDAPEIVCRLIEQPSHWGPYGAKGVGEPPAISSTPAVVAAVSDALGRDLSRAPVRPEHIVVF